MNEPAASQGDPRRSFSASIGVRLGLGVLVIVGASFAISLWAITAGEEREFRERNTREAGNIATVITRDLSRRMLEGGGMAVWKHISEEAQQHGAVSGARRILVLNREGVVKAGSDPGLVGTTVDLECPGCRAEPSAPAFATVPTPEGPRLRLVNAIPASPQCRACHQEAHPVRGYVSIDFDLAPLERSAEERRRSIAVVGVISVMVLLAMIAVLFQTLVLRPIDALIDAARGLGSGDLAARAAVPGKGELALLGEHFNRMAERLESQVGRILDAQTESALLYTLVVEASKNLETGDVATSVTRVVLDRLHPHRVVFFLESVGGSWICSHGGKGQEQRLESGHGDLASALRAGPDRANAMLEGLPGELLAGFGDEPAIRLASDAGGLAFALPIASEARLVGLLVASRVEVRVNQELLGNLRAHLALAAANSRNYTGAITDALTGLKNKRYGMARLEEALFSAKRYGSRLTVAMCDIDHFKRVNDTYGHSAGDAVLREVARRIAGSVRKADLVARYGGEEFLLIFAEAPADLLRNVGEKVREIVCGSPVALGEGQETAVTMSLGMATMQADNETAVGLIARADAALYRAKRAGRNRLELDP